MYPAIAIPKISPTPVDIAKGDIVEWAGMLTNLVGVCPAEHAALNELLIEWATLRAFPGDPVPVDPVLMLRTEIVCRRAARRPATSDAAWLALLTLADRVNFAHGHSVAVAS